MIVGEVLFPAVTAGGGAAVGGGEKVVVAAEKAADAAQMAKTAVSKADWAFTESNYRKAFQEANSLSDEQMVGRQVHHNFPQNDEPYFKAAGINIHEPQYLSLEDPGPHLRDAASFNRGWDVWIGANSEAERGTILDAGRTIASNHGHLVDW